MDIVGILRGMLGILILVGIAYAISNNKKNINWRLVGSGLLLQFVFAVFIIKGDSLGEFFFILGWPKAVFEYISSFFVVLLNFTTEGAVFIFGDLAISPGQD